MFKKVLGTSQISSGPPPLPGTTSAEKGEGPQPLQRAVFKEKINFSASSFDYGLIEKSNNQAEVWINSNAAITLVQIETFYSPTQAVTVVWYR